MAYVDGLFNRRLTKRRRLKHIPFLLLSIFLVPLLRIVIRFRVLGQSNIPKKGGAVVVANHLHNGDPMLIYSGMPRPIFWMGKEEIADYPVAWWIARQAGCFLVKRGSPDRAALRTAASILDEGLPVAMFPEGTRSVSGGLKEPFAGASLVALRSNAPVIPMVIIGSVDLPFNGVKQREGSSGWPRVEVHIGEPFMLSAEDNHGKRYSLPELTDAIMIELARLLPPDMRGIYSERDLTPHPAVSRENVVFTGLT